MTTEESTGQPHAPEGLSPEGLSPEGQRALAKRLFNQAWELIDNPDRSPEQDRLMLVTSCAAWVHWDAIGTEQNRAISDWQVAHVASLLGYGDLALTYATASFDRTHAADLPDWMQASALEGLARAHAAAGHQAERDDYLRRAIEAVAAVAEPGERELIASQIATVPPARTQ